ncbi:MAG: hypothetical protein PWP65_702 [Clostridia bacterium]|nr:hypothetical protein [Clostridia bacterium]
MKRLNWPTKSIYIPPATSLSKPKKDFVYDAIFIGGGAAGRFGSAFLRAMGGTQFTFEMDNHLGGQCCKHNCVPEHFAYDNAVYMDHLRWFSGLTWMPEIPDKIPMVPIFELFRKVRDTNVYKFMTDQSKDQLGIEFDIYKEAKIVDPNTVEVDGERYKARNLVIATGARPRIPDIPGVHLKNVLTNRELVNIDYEPEKVVVIGAGKTAAGYTSFFRACGCDVTVVNRSPIYRFLDDDVREFVISNMKRRGIKIYENVKIKEIRGTEKVEGVVIEENGVEKVIPCDTVFLGTGVIPNSEIAKPLGVEIGPNNEIVVNRKFQTSIPNVYAIGDVTGPPYVMSKARQSGMYAARNIMGEDVEMPNRTIPEFMFTTYEVTWVGLTEKQCREQYGDAVVIKMPPFNLDIGLPLAERSMIMAHVHPEMSGFQKAIIEPKSRRFVGFWHVGYGAKAAFQYLAVLLDKGLTVDEMATFHELFLNAEHFIQLTRLRAGQKNLTSL